MEELSGSERVHPSLQGGGRLFQQGKRQVVSDPKIVPEVVLMHTAPGRPTAGVLPFVGGATRRKASCWSHEAKRGQRRQPVKPLRRIRDQGQDALPWADGHILAVCAVFDQRRHAGTRTHLHRQQAMLWSRRGSKKTCHVGLLRPQPLEWTQAVVIAAGS